MVHSTLIVGRERPDIFRFFFLAIVFRSTSTGVVLSRFLSLSPSPLTIKTKKSNETSLPLSL